jgi:uncharacterized protein HemX
MTSTGTRLSVDVGPSTTGATSSTTSQPTTTPDPPKATSNDSGLIAGGAFLVVAIGLAAVQARRKSLKRGAEGSNR